MEIAVCVKQVIDTKEITLDENNNIIRRDGMSMSVNPADRTALSMATRLKRQFGGRITAVTMGTPGSVSVLHEAALMGANVLYLVTDPAFASADTYATAFVLSEVLKKTGPFDLVLCGRKAVDGETGQVGPSLSVMLGVDCMTNLIDIEESDCPGFLNCTRLTETSEETYRITLPAVLTLCEGILLESRPSIAALRRAAKIPVISFSNQELHLPLQSVGMKGSWTRVRKVSVSSGGDRECRFLSLEEGVKAAAEMIEQCKESRQSS